MRNLKRALSLALASVMLMGMMAVGTGASYADVDSKDNAEAIEVLQAVGVMSGDENGKFNPDKNVTRNEMAVVMANLLDLKVSDFKAAKVPFTDVPAWASAYVAACVADGITAGYSATYFGGNDGVTAAQAALMLMKALGYFQYQQDFGDDWQLATVKQASRIELFDGVDAGAAAALTRNELAQMVLNALEAVMVEPDGNGGTTIKGDGFEITTGNVKYEERTSSNERYAAITDEEGAVNLIQLGEYLYKGDLEKDAGTPDKFGRPSTKWVYDGKDVITVADKADATYAGAVKVKTIYADLKLDADVATTEIDYFEDTNDSAVGSNAITKKGTAEYGAAGQTVEVYYDDDAGEVTICVISSYLGVVVDDDYVKDGDEGILIDVFGISDLFFEATGYENDDLLLVTVSDVDGTNEIQAIIGEPETVTGSITRKGSGATPDLTIGGTKYAQAAQFDATGDGDVISGTDTFTIDSDITYILYLDANGAYLAAALDEDNGKTDLVYVFDTARGTTLDGKKLKYANYATVVYMDGTTEEVMIGEAKEDEDNLPALSTLPKGELVDLKYNEDDDEYTLVESGDYTSESHEVETTKVELEKGDKYAKLDQSSNYYLNSKTSYIFISTNDDGEIDKVEVIVGGVDYDIEIGTTVAFAYDSDKRADYVVFQDDYQSSAKDVLYIKSNSVKGEVDGGILFEGYFVGETAKKEIAVYSVGGSVTTTDANKPTAGFYEYSEKSDGTLKLTALSDGVYAGKTVTSVLDGMIDVADMANPADASGAAIVDLTDVDETVSTESDYNAYGRTISSLSTLKRVVDSDSYGDVTVNIYVNDDDEVEAIFIMKVAAP